MPAPEAGFLTRWSLAPAYAAHSLPVRELPARKEATEVVATCDESGRVNLAESLQPTAEGGLTTTVARTQVHAEHRCREVLNVGFSDRASVFLNGRLLFSGDNTYRTRSPRYLGVMTVDHVSLLLDLEEGVNELAVVVSESFGGWGLTARLPERAAEGGEAPAQDS